MKLVYYVAATSDTRSGNSSYALRAAEEPRYVSETKVNSTTPEMLWEAINQVLTLIEPCSNENLVLIMNNQYVVETLMEGKLFLWKESGWIRENGEPVKHKDLLEKILEILSVYMTDGVNITARFPETKQEEFIFKSTQKYAKAARRYK